MDIETAGITAAGLGTLATLSGPIQTLVEKMSNAVGVLYEPTRIKRKAAADVEARLIKSKGNFELQQHEERALKSLLAQEVRREDNIQQIMHKAVIKLPNNFEADKLDEDWVVHFFKQCDTVSDEQMQSLWANLLAGEVSNPGTFSKRTVNFVSNMSKQDAESFAALCQFVWKIGGRAMPLIYDLSSTIYSEQNIDFNSLTHLETIGLINFRHDAAYIQHFLTDCLQVVVTYQQKHVLLTFESKPSINSGSVEFTAVGRELERICHSKKNQVFCDYVINKWKIEGINI
jgi:hypothetical protein